MKIGNLYLVTYKQYKNDSEPKKIKVFAYDKIDCELKMDESGLLAHTGLFANNDGRIISVKILESGIL